MSEEYIKKEDALRIASIATFSVNQVVSALKDLPTYSIPNSVNIESNTVEKLDQILKWGYCFCGTEDNDFYKAIKNAIEIISSLERLKAENKGEWISISKCGYPKPKDEYKYFLTIDNKGEITIQEFLLSLDEEPQPYFSGMRNIVAWMSLPEPYKGE